LLTLVALHRPIWSEANREKSAGWKGELLAGRKYTAFAGHVHRYQKIVRNGMNHYQFATTGGSSRMRGTRDGEFDHIVWVTMKKDGPVLANIRSMASARELQRLRPTSRVWGNQADVPRQGQGHCDGTPAVGARSRSTSARRRHYTRGDAVMMATALGAEHLRGLRCAPVAICGDSDAA
jgi:hypothetical protein